MKGIIRGYNRLTGLEKSESFRDDLTNMIDSVDGNEFSIFVFEISNLNYINRYLDYEYGESAVLKTVESAEDVFVGCRMYSIYTNEIAVLVENGSISDVYRMGLDFMKKFSVPVRIKDTNVYISIKSGIVRYPEHGDTAKKLYKNMGRTLSQCDSDGCDISIYDDEAAKKIQNECRTRFQLYEAINNDELRLDYQPKYSIGEDRITGAEALLRWDGSSLNIGDVIDIAEKTNLINHLTKWVVKNMVEQLERWKREGIDIKVSMNVSPKDIMDVSFLNHLEECIRNSSIEAEVMEIELTERCLVENEKSILEAIGRIKDLGLDISIDDYGTGYNSLKNMLDFPFHNIKIDKFFVDNIGNKGAFLLMEGIIKSSKEMGIGIIVEGVESGDQYEIFRRMGCDYIQGYLISKPLRPDEFAEFLVKHNNHRTGSLYSITRKLADIG